ncbi:hypothetical protein BDN67DRAFT_982537 [Paxillus ammoniavirescens]|nr:hypothetical protein BDN67DRAFT_982537 [Paxillus ammoniavirescens]
MGWVTAWSSRGITACDVAAWRKPRHRGHSSTFNRFSVGYVQEKQAVVDQENTVKALTERLVVWLGPPSGLAAILLVYAVHPCRVAMIMADPPLDGSSDFGRK